MRSALTAALAAFALFFAAAAATSCSSPSSTPARKDGGADAGACATNADCPLGLTCDPATHKCRALGGDAGGGGDGGSPGADAGSCTRLSCAPDKICVGGQCVAPAMCDGGGAICCNTQNSGADCPIGKYCDFGQCQPGCFSSADCGLSAPVCDPNTHTCGKCTATAQCPSGYVCDTASGGCKVPAGGDGGASCTRNNDCLGGLVCQGGACVPCGTTSQCNPGQECQSDAGTCVFALDGGGATCTAADAGVADSCTTQQGNNYWCDPSSGTCKYRCLSNSDCSSGTSCDTTAGSPTYGQCVPSTGCNCAQVTCPAGSTCDPTNCSCSATDAGACSCSAVTCPAGYSCDATTCSCVSNALDGGSTGTGTDGTACTSNSDCASGYICSTFFDQPPVCRQSCSCANSSCPTGQNCLDWFSGCNNAYPLCHP